MAFLMPKVEYIGRVTRNTKAGVVNAKAVADHFQVSVSAAVEWGVGLGLLKAW